MIQNRNVTCGTFANEFRFFFGHYLSPKNYAVRSARLRPAAFCSFVLPVAEKSLTPRGRAVRE